MWKILAFVVGSVILIYISRTSLQERGSHGFYRFFAWEFILALLLLNIESWFLNPFSWYQISSWILLCASLAPLILGMIALRKYGRPAEKREGEDYLIAFEKTTRLVTSGIYGIIRHPLYSSLLLLAWGIFFKIPSWLGAILLFLATASLFMTARADEEGCIRFFGDAYRDYMQNTKRFIPWLF